MPWSLTRLVVRAIIPDLYTRFGSANAALQWLRSQGLGYRRQDFLADWREITGIQKVQESWKYIPKKFLPRPEEIVKTEKALRTQYLYTGRIMYITAEGEVVQRYVSLGSDYLRPWGQVREAFEEMGRRYGAQRILRVDLAPVLSR